MESTRCNSTLLSLEFIKNETRHFNPFTLMNYPCNVTLESNLKVVRIKEMVTNLGIWLSNKFSSLVTEEIELNRTVWRTWKPVLKCVAFKRWKNIPNLLSWRVYPQTVEVFPSTQRIYKNPLQCALLFLTRGSVRTSKLYDHWFDRFWLFGVKKKRLTDRLKEWLTDWLTNWQIDWLTD